MSHNSKNGYKRIKGIKLLINIFGLLIIALMILGLKTNQNEIKEEEVKTSEKFQSRIDEIIYRPYNLEKSYNVTVEYIIRQLGAPTNIKVKKIKNIHNPEITDNIYYLYYDGLYLIIYKGLYKGFVSYISTTSDKYKLKWDLKIGSSKDNILRILGSPIKQEEYV